MEIFILSHSELPRELSKIKITKQNNHSRNLYIHKFHAQQQPFPYSYRSLPYHLQFFLALPTHKTKGLGSSVRPHSPPRPPSSMFSQQLLSTHPSLQPPLSPFRGPTPSTPLLRPFCVPHCRPYHNHPITPLPQFSTFCCQLYDPTTATSSPTPGLTSHPFG